MRWIISPKYWGALGACLALAPYVQADISGQVFRDFNSNGSLDSNASLTEVGMADITIKAFDSAGLQVGASATSAADGSYTLTGLASGADYRVEFSWAETWLQPSVAGGSSVQFVKDGATAINLGVNNPLDYSQADATISVSTPVAIVGPTTQTVATGKDHRTYAALVKFPFTATGKPNSPGYIPPTSLATHAQIGSTSGAAFHRESKRLFVAAYAKRAVGFGPSGPGAIYSIDSNGTVSTHAIVPNAGSDTHDFTGDYTTVNYDTAAVTSAGKSSLGDLEVSADGQWLYVVNLSDRHLYAVSTNTANTVTDLGLITRPTSCPENDFRPFGLGMDETNTLYVGAVCSNESGTSSTGSPSAIVLKYDGVGGFSEVLNLSLAFNSSNFWKNWSDTLMTNYAAQAVSLYQPLLSDLVFDGKDMILAFRNRAWEVGYIPGGSSPTMSHVLKTCWNGTTWVLENNGTCAGVLGALPNYSVAAEAGPGGGYFFDMRDSLATYGGQSVINAMGSLAIVPGRGMLATLADPQYLISGGTTHLNPANGSSSMPYEIFRGTADGSNGGGAGYFGKTSGLGDLELMLDLAPTEIGNRVWRDTDADGIQDAGEAGIDGIAVVLTCGANTATTTSANGGQYLFSSTGNASFMKAGESCTISIAANQASLNGLSVTAQNQDGLTNNHAVTDVRDSDANPDGSISFTLGAAGENNHSLDIGYTSKPTITYSAVSGPEPMTCTSDVRLATSVSVNGDSQAAGSTGADFNSLVTFDYATTGVLTTPYSAATAGQLGAVWGLAYDSVRKKLYTSAFLKRHTSFGPNGSGAIYQMDTQSATATPSLLIDLAANGVDVGADPRAVSDGTVDSPDELPIDGTKPSWDQTAFAQVAKISIGDIDMSADGNTLWAINLKQRELVAVNLTNKTVGAKLAIPNPGCSQGDYRPWALKLHLGKAWIGTVCSAEQSQVAADLKAYVQVFDGSSFSNAFELPLDYTKGNVGNGPGAEKWQPWLTSYQTLATDPKFAIYPQPILSDIEFDMDGSMILGFMDRMGHQVGSNNYTPNHPDTSLIQGQTGGDILRVCNNNGVYTLESNATCSSGSTKGKDNAQGPNDGEYYWGDMWDYNPWNAQGGYHQETSFGGLAFKAGSGELAVTAMNPLTPNAVAGGIIWLDNATGGQSTQHAEGTQLYQQAANNPYFGKAAGMGDIEIFCADAMILPDLKLVKEVSKSIGKRGETISYTLTLTNEASAAASKVSVQDLLPAQMLYVSHNGDGTYDPLTGVWSLGNVAGASTKQLTITVTIK